MRLFFSAETVSLFDFSSYDYIVDAVDTVSAKILLIERAKACNKPVISCMGTGNKLDPSCFQIADIAKTSVCPLAKVMRTELKKRKIKKVKVLFSTELAPKEKKRRMGLKEEKVQTQETQAVHRKAGALQYILCSGSCRTDDRRRGDKRFNWDATEDRQKIKFLSETVFAVSFGFI